MRSRSEFPFSNPHRTRSPIYLVGAVRLGLHVVRFIVSGSVSYHPKADSAEHGTVRTASPGFPCFREAAPKVLLFPKGRSALQLVGITTCSLDDTPHAIAHVLVAFSLSHLEFEHPKGATWTPDRECRLVKQVLHRRARKEASRLVQYQLSF